MENFKKLTNTENILFAEELWKSVSKENLEIIAPVPNDAIWNAI